MWVHPSRKEKWFGGVSTDDENALVSAAANLYLDDVYWAEVTFTLKRNIHMRTVQTQSHTRISKVAGRGKRSLDILYNHKRNTDALFKALSEHYSTLEDKRAQDVVRTILWSSKETGTVYFSKYIEEKERRSEA